MGGAARVPGVKPSEKHVARVVRRLGDPFGRVVNLDLREELDSDRAAWLRRKDVVVDWARELHSIAESLNLQIAARRALLSKSPYHPSRHCWGKGPPPPEYLAEKKDFDEWYGRVMRLKRAVDERISEARTLVAYYGLAPDPGMWTFILLRLEGLLRAGDIEAARRVVDVALSHQEAV